MLRQTKTAILLLVALTAAAGALAHEHPVPHSHPVPHAHPAKEASPPAADRLIETVPDEGGRFVKVTAGPAGFAPRAPNEACGSRPCARGSSERRVADYTGTDAEANRLGIGTLALVGLGLVALGWVRRRQRPPLPG